MEEIKNKVKELKLNDSVRFLGRRNDVNELYQAFDVFCLPSLYEGLPVVGVEAQASGLLCILSDAMTKETKVLESTKFNSLKNDSLNWADLILNSVENHKRVNCSKEMKENKFNIKIECEKLEKKYCVLLGGE